VIKTLSNLLKVSREENLVLAMDTAYTHGRLNTIAWDAGKKILVSNPGIHQKVHRFGAAILFSLLPYPPVASWGILLRVKKVTKTSVLSVAILTHMKNDVLPLKVMVE